MPAADCPKASKLTFFVALFSQSTLATVTGWPRMIWVLFFWWGEEDKGAVEKDREMVNIVVHDRKTKFSNSIPVYFLSYQFYLAEGCSLCTDRKCDRSLIFIFTVLTQNLCLNNCGHSLKF